MTTALAFPELLERTGARPGRGRRWWCGKCDGKTPVLSVDLVREVFYCHRCESGGGRRTLEGELGIQSHKPNPMEERRRRIVRAEAEQFAEWVRRKRIETAALLRDLDRHEATWREVGREQLAAREPVSEEVFAKLQMLAAWQGHTEGSYLRLCDFEHHAGELYREFVREREAA